MKIVIALVMMMWTPAFAQDTPFAQSLAQLQKLAGCQAIEVNLMHLHNQSAAMIMSLSSTPPPQLELMRQSFQTMAADNAKQLSQMGIALNKVIIPSFNEKAEEAKQHWEPILSEKIDQLDEILETPTYEGQVKVQTMLLDRSRECEVFTTTILKANTL